MIKVILLSLIITVSGSPLWDEHRSSAEKNVSVVLGEGELKHTQTHEGKEYFLFASENSLSGSKVIFSSAKGRYDNFDYMVILDPSDEIINIKILKYRSDYGYEISGKKWLKQFYNKPGSFFEYGKNIDALSGATYSAPSLVNDINTILDHLRKERAEPL